MRIEIIGDGTVGNALGKIMKVKPRGKSNGLINADVVIICVPTPTNRGKQDLSNIKQTIQRIKSTKLVILRSTVLPGTTEKLQKLYKLPIVFVPEFGFEKTMEKDLRHPDFCIIGNKTGRQDNLTRLTCKILPKSKKYIYVKSIIAEYAKYFRNIWGCSQVALANSFYDWCCNHKIYDKAIEIAQNHKNMSHWGWKISDKGYRGYGGKCLPKDIQAAISQCPHQLWETFERYNKGLQKEK